MTSDQFVFWLNGHIELGGERPSEAQWEMIKEHLATCFKKETRSLSDIQYCFKPDIGSEVNKNGDKIDWSGMDFSKFPKLCDNASFDLNFNRYVSPIYHSGDSNLDKIIPTC